MSILLTRGTSIHIIPHTWGADTVVGPIEPSNPDTVRQLSTCKR